MANRERPVRRNVIHASLRKQILDGRWGPGAYLPSEADLGRRFRASRVTIRAALKLLRADGLLQTKPGVGWCVGSSGPTSRERPIEFVATPFPTAGYVFDGVRRYLGEAGLHLPTHLTPVEHFAKDVRPLSERVDLSKVGGLIFFSPTPLPRTQVEEARAARVPIVCAGLAAHADYDTICTDNVRGLELLVESLVERGHRHIGFASADDVTRADPSFGLRQLGYEQAMRRRELQPAVVRTPANYFLGPEEERLILGWLKGLEAEGRRPTCLIGACDSMACQLLTLLTRHGLSVPREISVAGFDRDRTQELAVTRFGLRALTSVEQPWEEIGRTAASRLVARLARDPAGPSLTLVPPRLYEGDSVKVLR